MAIRKPVIAAVNGPVAGMVVPFALCLRHPDRLARRDVPHRLLAARADRRVGNRHGCCRASIGPSAALDLLWTSRRVDAEEAMRLGLGNYLVPADELLAFAGATSTTSPPSARRPRWRS